VVDQFACLLCCTPDLKLAIILSIVSLNDGRSLRKAKSNRTQIFSALAGFVPLLKSIGMPLCYTSRHISKVVPGILSDE
jgi:hypothetical protein